MQANLKQILNQAWDNIKQLPFLAKALFSLLPLAPLGPKWLLKWDVTRSIFSPLTEIFTILLVILAVLYVFGIHGRKSTIGQKQSALKSRCWLLIPPFAVLLFWQAAVYLPTDVGFPDKWLNVALAILVFCLVTTAYIFFWVLVAQIFALYVLLRPQPKR